MLSQILLSLTVAGGALSLADDETTSLTVAVQTLNEQALKLPEARSQEPLTEDEIVDAIHKLSRDESKLTESEFQQLQQLVATRRLAKNALLRQFVRYNDGKGVQHGWWVRLMLLRKDKSPFVVTLREVVLLRRPYTQLERQFQQQVFGSGNGNGNGSGFPTLNRLVVYFDADPRFNVTQQFAKQGAETLATAVKKAIDDRNPAELEKCFHWQGVSQGQRSSVLAEAEQITKRQLASISVTPRQFGGRLNHWQSFQIWDSNLAVLGYIVLEFSDKNGPSSLTLEFGETPTGARLVNYTVSRDDVSRLIGKRLSRPVSVEGLPSVQLLDGSLEWLTQIDSPDELPELRHANFEIWKLPPSP